MVNCPKCGTAVREEKAFCHNCGSPMNAAKAERETPLPDIGATVLEPPRRPAAATPPTSTSTPPTPMPPPPPSQPFVPPAVVADVRPTGGAPVLHRPAGVGSTPPGASPAGRRSSSRKIGFGFVLLLLFLMFLAFVLAVVID